MLVKRLDVYHYLTAFSCNEHVVRDPTWAQIDEAIRRLDRFHYPWVWLRLTEEQDDDNYMTVMGGEGAYWLSISVDGFDQRRLLYPGQGSEVIRLWTSDQGFSDERCYVSFDLGVAVQAARFFAETAGFDPSLPWEPQERRASR